jgi:hypothetical protein
MEKNQILELISFCKRIDITSADAAEKIISSKYQISREHVESDDIIAALQRKNLVIAGGKIIIGYDGGRFEDSDGEFFPVTRPLDAVIVKAVRDGAETFGPVAADPFIISGRCEWEGKTFPELLPEGCSLTGLNVGEVFLPPHSVVVNFLNPTHEEREKKAVSVLSGININVLDPENYYDNILHEIGHLFWRCRLLHDERERFENHFKHLKPAAIYEKEWERNDEQEVFCTIYKWYMKSLLINKAFYNILAHEEPEGLKLLQAVFDRVAKDKIVGDVWELTKDDILAYLSPKFDIRTGRFIRKSGSLDRVKNVEVPRDIRENIHSRIDGAVRIVLDQIAAPVPMSGNVIDYDAADAALFRGLNKAKSGDDLMVYMDMDGVVADFAEGYQMATGRSAYKDDNFTVTQAVTSIPQFFRNLPPVGRGVALYNELQKRGYTVTFLTTPMEGYPGCRAEKLEWINQYFGPDVDVIFSKDKAEYARHDRCVLIDDMVYNLEPWMNAGGTAIDFTRQTNDGILRIIEDTASQKKEEETIRAAIKNMEVNTTPTPEQKQSGNYRKGDVEIKGLKIKIENPKGSIRFGFDGSGKKWVTKMRNHYGYIVNGDAGNDGDKVDCFIGDRVNGNKVFVINQRNPKSGLFDEHKVMIGFSDCEEARQAYLSNYENGWDGIMSITPSNTKKLREWLQYGNKTEPFEDGKQKTIEVMG